MKKYYKYINTFFVVTPMTLLMSLVAIFRNYGFKEDWNLKFFEAWLIMLPVAYFAAFIIIPIAGKLTTKILK